MAKVLAGVIPKPHAPVEVRELSEPELEPGSALLEVALSEVCGTDVYLQQGRLDGVPYPLIPGHVSVGHLSKIRGQMLDVAGRPFAEGDRVTFLDVHRTCNACWHCLVAKATTRCPHRKVYGITYGLADGLAGGCALPTALHAVERAEVALGDTVLVLGSGPVGLSIIVFALMRGALRVLCIGAPEHRLEAARKVGAAATLNVETSDEKVRV